MLSFSVERSVPSALTLTLSRGERGSERESNARASSRLRGGVFSQNIDGHQSSSGSTRFGSGYTTQSPSTGEGTFHSAAPSGFGFFRRSSGIRPPSSSRSAPTLYTSGLPPTSV